MNTFEEWFNSAQSLANKEYFDKICDIAIKEGRIVFYYKFQTYENWYTCDAVNDIAIISESKIEQIAEFLKNLYGFSMKEDCGYNIIIFNG